jgi:hypothetical protein
MNIKSKIVLSVSLVLSSAAISRPNPSTGNFQKLVEVPISALSTEGKGKSRKGREIIATMSGFEKSARRVLVQSGLHGNEVLPQEFVQWLASRYARGESLLNELAAENVLVDFLPFANPDGIAAHERLNSEGVNLNRNFSILWGASRENPGAKRFSEPETQAIQELFQVRNYIAAVDIHGYINWLVGPTAPSDLGFHVSSNELERHKAWTKILESVRQDLPDYELKTAGGLGDGGAFEDWAFWEAKAFAFCLEIQSPDNTDVPGSASQTATFLNYEKVVFKAFLRAIRLHAKIEIATPGKDIPARLLNPRPEKSQS